MTFKAKRKHCRELCWWLTEGVGFEVGKGKLFYLVFLAGAKPGGFMVYLHWTKGNLEALSGLLWENGYFFHALLSLLEDHCAFGKDRT